MVAIACARYQGRAAAQYAAPELSALIVDDSAVNRKVAGFYLQSLGFSVRFACDGFEALRAATEAWFDVIIMDVLLPGINGLDCVRQIRMKETTGRSPIILGWSTTASPNECMEAGMNAVLPKPMDRASLEFCLRCCHVYKQ